MFLISDFKEHNEHNHIIINVICTLYSRVHVLVHATQTCHIHNAFTHIQVLVLVSKLTQKR